MYNANEKVEPINVAEEVSRSFLDYSMSVIIYVHCRMRVTGSSRRREEFSMRCTICHLFPNRQHRKCAKICGDTSGTITRTAKR